MEKIDNEQLLDEIWNDANFKSTKNLMEQSQSTNNKQIRKLNDRGKIVAYCKVCNHEIFISENYTGKYPLCNSHRDPNDRPYK